MLNRQEAFDIAVKGVISQGVASYAAGSGCLYRGPNGTKCAVGFLIPDDVYAPALENNQPGSRKFDHIAEKLGWTGGDREFLRRFQASTHDGAYFGTVGTSVSFVDEFRNRAREFAREWDLSDAVLDQVAA